MELWGDPAVTALIDSRGKLTNAQVGEKLRAEIERERSGGVQYWVLFDHRNGEFVGCGGLRPWLYTLRRGEFRSLVPSREALLGQGLRNGSSVRRARIRLGKIAVVESLRRASPRQSCFGENPQEARIRVHWKCLLRANRLDASVLRLQSADPETEHFRIAVGRNSS